MKKKNIIQFTPYFPPHIGGLEKVAQDIHTNWIYGKSIVFSGDSEQSILDDLSTIFFPSYEIIPNFPVPMIWGKSFWQKWKAIKEIVSGDDEYIIITHTRFFLSSFIGGVFAKKYKCRWVHIEHGSDYVKLGSKFKSKIAYFYDKTLGKWVVKNADKVLSISRAAEKFIKNEFSRGDINTWYRGVDFPELKVSSCVKNKFPNKILIGYVGRLYKWKNVESLIDAYYNLGDTHLQLIIVGDGEDLDRLKKIDRDNKVYFTGPVDAITAYSYQSQFDIHIHPSSPGGGLATTLLQAMNLGCYIVATPYEGADEVITHGENGILLKDDSIGELERGIKNAVNTIENKEIYSKNNKELIEKEFNLETTICSLYNII